MGILNNVLGFNLDSYQKKAIYENSKNVLLLAGAGSGKTLTIVGKIRYLIEIMHFKEDEILCLSLTNEAVLNLKNKLKFYNYNVDVFTFHKLAYKLISKYKEIYITDDKFLTYFVHEYLFFIIKDNIKYQNIVLYYFGYQVLFAVNISYKMFIKFHYEEMIELENIIIRFINLYKINYGDYNYLKDLYKKLFGKNKKLLIVIYKIIILYDEELKSQNKVDLNDLLYECLNYIKINDFNYKYIIVDEYQDVSMVKYLIVKKMLSVFKAKLFAVGDDYQTIFSFTGCNINLFLEFKKCYVNSIILTIPNIYRNSQELVDVASKFITKNKKQIKKNLISCKTNLKPIVFVYYKDLKVDLNKLVLEIKTNILVLARNNSDFNKINFIKDVRYLTVHKSKGLEEDNVILINNLDDKNGFPSKMSNSFLINKLLINDDYLYEEERRLFYVALTRTKNNIYLFVNKNKESIFIKELRKDYGKYIIEKYI